MKLLSSRSGLLLASTVYILFSWQQAWAQNCSEALSERSDAISEISKTEIIVTDDLFHLPYIVRKYTRIISHSKMLHKYSKYLGTMNGKLFFYLFDKDSNGKWYDIVMWTRQGNPIIRIGYNDIHFEPTDLSLIHYKKYQRQLDQNGQSLTDITRRRPISVHLSTRDSSYSPQFKIQDGHHRYIFARNQRTDIYVKISEISIDDPYKYGMTWSQGKQHGMRND